MQNRFSEAIALLYSFEDVLDISDDMGLQEPPRLSELMQTDEYN